MRSVRLRHDRGGGANLNRHHRRSGGLGLLREVIRHLAKNGEMLAVFLLLLSMLLLLPKPVVHLLLSLMLLLLLLQPPKLNFLASQLVLHFPPLLVFPRRISNSMGGHCERG